MLNCNTHTEEERLFQPFAEQEGWCSPEFSTGCMTAENDD